MDKELLTKLKQKKKESYKDGSRIRAVRRKIETLSEHAAGKDKAHLELSLGRSCHRQQEDPATLKAKGRLGKIQAFCEWAWVLVTEVV